MSHFTVLVPASDEEGALYRKLIPYYEYGCSEHCDNDVAPYLEFNDKTDETKRDWETGTVARVKMPDGRLLSPYDDEFRVPGIHVFETTHKVPDGLEQIEVPYTQLYPNFDDYATDYEGLKKHENGRYGYLHNPNAKWDWYSVGGRWKGLLKLKSSSDRADVALAGNIDWQAMAYAQLNTFMQQFYDYKSALVKVRDLVYTGEQTSEMQSAQDKAIELYNDTGNIRNQNCRAAFKNAADYAESCMVERVLQERKIYTFDTFQETADKFYLSDTEYKALFQNRAITHAFFDLEGRWIERGDMGWWGCCDDENDAAYNVAFWKFVKSLPDEQQVYVVDCHI